MSDIVKNLKDEIKKGLKDLMNDFGKDKPFMEKLVEELYANPIVKKQADPEALLLQLIRAKLAGELGRPTSTYQFLVLAVEQPKAIIPKKERAKPLAEQKRMIVASVKGVALPADAKSPQTRFATASFFDEDAKKLEGVEEGNFYTVNLTGGLKDEIYQLSGTNATLFRKIEGEIPLELQKTEGIYNILESWYKRIDICEASQKVDGKMKLVRGYLSDATIITSKKTQNKFGLYKLVDDSMGREEIQALGGGLSIFVSPDQVRFATLSEVAVLGLLTNDQEYGLSMRGELILGLIAEPYKADENMPATGGTPPGDGGNAKKELEDSQLF